MTTRGIFGVALMALALVAAIVSLTFWLLGQTLPGVEDVPEPSSALLFALATILLVVYVAQRNRISSFT